MQQINYPCLNKNCNGMFETRGEMKLHWRFCKLTVEADPEPKEKVLNLDLSQSTDISPPPSSTQQPSPPKKRLNNEDTILKQLKKKVRFGDKFTSRYEIKRTPEGQLKCNWALVCNRKFDDIDQLKKHFKKEHCSETGNLIYCPKKECDKFFGRKGDLNVHLATH